MNTEPTPDNHYHLDDTPRYEYDENDFDPDEWAHDPERIRPGRE